MLPPSASTVQMRRHLEKLEAAQASATAQESKSIAAEVEQQQQQQQQQQQANETLLRVHEERTARQRQLAEDEAAARSALRAEEEARRKAMARQKKDRRKQRKDQDAEPVPDEGMDEIDAALASLGSARVDDGAESSSVGDGPSVLPWSRDREAERNRERLKSRLHDKVAEAHRARQPKAKDK